MFSNWAEKAQSSVTQALEKTGDAISTAATNAGKTARNNNKERNDASPPLFAEDAPRGRYTTEQQQQQQQTTTVFPPTLAAIPPPPPPAFLTNLSKGWNNVVHSTKSGLQQAETKLKQQHEKLQEQLSKAKVQYIYQRDPSLPLDVPALRDAHMVYITNRILTLGHPAST